MMMQYNTTSNAYSDIETVYTYDEWLKEYKRNEEIKRQRIQEAVFQKMLGFGLLILGIVGCLVMPEDAGGFVFTSVLGILRLVY